MGRGGYLEHTIAPHVGIPTPPLGGFGFGSKSFSHEIYTEHNLDKNESRFVGADELLVCFYTC